MYKERTHLSEHVISVIPNAKKKTEDFSVELNELFLFVKRRRHGVCPQGGSVLAPLNVGIRRQVFTQVDDKTFAIQEILLSQMI